jgi:hypothetical protein
MNIKEVHVRPSVFWLLLKNSKAKTKKKVEGMTWIQYGIGFFFFLGSRFFSFKSIRSTRVHKEKRRAKLGTLRATPPLLFLSPSPIYVTALD